MTSDVGTKRIQVVDIARFYAMALVFYGHFVERFMLLKNPAGFVQYKFIYSFHMMLFFALAGYVARESDLDFDFGNFLKHRFISRLLPFLFFTAVFMLFPAFFSGDFHQLVLPSVNGYITGLVLTISGIPAFCVPSWFLLMLFSVELVHYCAFRFLRSTNVKIVIAIIGFYVVGYWLNLKLDIFNPLKERDVGYNYLFIHEAITMYAFYLLGVYLRRMKFLVDEVSPLITLPGIVITFLIVLFTFKRNTGHFSFHIYDAVVVMFSSHGHFIWFIVPALAGIAMVLFLARITPPQKNVVWMGQNTLILMCLNGVFYHYINFRVAEWFLSDVSSAFWPVFGIGFLMTVVSLLACVPFIYIFNRFVPQLVGKPKRNGPWLRNFL